VLITFAVTFGIVAVLLVALTSIAAFMVTAGGGGAFVADIYRSLGLSGSIAALLGICFVVAIALTSVATVVLWISHPATASTSSPASTLASSRTAAPNALIPDICLVAVLAAIGLAGLHLARPAPAMAYWQWAEWAPWIAGFCLAIAAAMFASRWMRGNLTSAWLRLRFVLLLGAAGLVFNSAAMQLDENHGCSRGIVTAIAQTENAAGLARYLARHKTCHGEEADRVLYTLLTLDTSSPDDKRSMMTSLLKSGAHFDRGEWSLLQRARPYDIELALEAVRDAADRASMSEDALGEVLMHIAYENNALMFNRFVSHGVRLDADPWRDYAFHMLQRSLEKPDHSWDFYDALIAAGAQFDPALQALLHSIRTASIAAVQGWAATDWTRLVAPDQDRSYTFGVFAIVHAPDSQSRTQYLRLAGTDMTRLLAQTQQPALCDLVRIADPRASLAQLESMQSLSPACHQAMWDLRNGAASQD
jgi:hypothetical protein